MNQQDVHATLNNMLEQPRLRTLYTTVRELFEAQGSIGHGWEHVRRVTVNAAWIGREEQADLDIVMPAIILHDIGFVTHPDEPKNHPEHGARECRRFLTEWSTEDQEKIALCILKHKAAYPGYNGTEPETLEERVVCDADQIDKFGWLGITQMVKVYAEYGMNGNDKYRRHAGLVDALKHIVEIQLYTETGRRIVAERAEPVHLEAARQLHQELSLSETWTDPC